MSEGLNRVTLLGNLGADPELRVTNSDAPVLKMRLATSETYLDRDKQRQERTEWHTVLVWGRRAEGLHKVLGRGDRILVEGSLRTRQYEDRDGAKRSVTEVVAANVVLCGGGKTERTANPRTNRGEGEPAGGDDWGSDSVPF